MTNRSIRIRGEAPNTLRETMQQALEEIQAELGDELIAFSGQTEPFETRDDLLQDCMQAQYQARKKGLSAKTLIVLLLLLALLGYWAADTWQQARERNEYIAMLQQEAGIVVTGSSLQNGVLIVDGLRDPLARDPQLVLAESGLAEIRVEHRFVPYQSLAEEFVAQRARRILAPPEGVEIRLEDGRLIVSGISELAWRERLDLRLPLISGVDSVDAAGLRLLFEPALLRPPQGVAMQLEDGVLYVDGAAGQDWIASLDGTVERYPEIDSIDTRALVNSTELALVNDIQALEKEAVFFDVATSFDFDSADTPRITGLVKNIIASADKLSRNVLIVVKGYSDSVGSFEDNVFLSKERADYVAQAIYNAGINPRYVSIEGLEQPVKPETSEAERRFNRRVGFEVIVE